MGILDSLAMLPRTQTTSSSSCIILIISFVVSGLQSVKSETSKGTLSTFSRCGRILSMPLGSLARLDMSKAIGALCSVMVLAVVTRLGEGDMFRCGFGCVEEFLLELRYSLLRLKRAFEVTLSERSLDTEKELCFRRPFIFISSSFRNFCRSSESSESEEDNEESEFLRLGLTLA